MHDLENKESAARTTSKEAVKKKTVSYESTDSFMTESKWLLESRAPASPVPNGVARSFCH